MERNTRLAQRVLAACFIATLLFALAATAQAPARVVAVADVHGSAAALVSILQRTKMIDENRRWIGGPATLVQTGDVLDRGVGSRTCLDLVMGLERQAAKQGGRVIPLLGNHEVMNLMGDVRYVTAEIYRTFATEQSEKVRERAFQDYVKFLSVHRNHAHTAVIPNDEATRKKWMEEHPPGFFEYRDAFGPKGKYGRWIRNHHAVVQVDPGVFVHGGLSPTLQFRDVPELDQRVRSELPAFDSVWRTLVDKKMIWHYMKLAEAVQYAGEELKWLQASGQVDKDKAVQEMQKLVGYKSLLAASSEGPLWYRGLAQEPEEKLMGGVKALLERLKALYIVDGHTVLSKSDITVRFENHVFLLDTGMLKEEYGGRASALEIQNGRFTAYYADAEPKVLPSPAGRSGGK
jgi:hypothetical protein